MRQVIARKLSQPSRLNLQYATFVRQYLLYRHQLIDARLSQNALAAYRQSQSQDADSKRIY